MSSAAGTASSDLAPNFSGKNMEIIFVLILISLIVAAGFLLAYLWATRSGQFDDAYTPSVRMLFDDELVDNQVPEEADSTNKQNETSNSPLTSI